MATTHNLPRDGTGGERVSLERTQSESGPEKVGGGGWTEGLIAAAMAIVLMATAVAGWRSSDLGSRAGDAERLGMIQSIQHQDFLNLDWQLAYQEAGQCPALSPGRGRGGGPWRPVAIQGWGRRRRTSASTCCRIWRLLGEPLTTDATYAEADGSLDIGQRFADLQAQNADLAALDPEGAFTQAEYYQSQQRSYFVGAVLLALSLFWLGLAEITRGKARITGLVMGVLVFLFGLAWIAGVEVLWALARWVEV